MYVRMFFLWYGVVNCEAYLCWKILIQILKPFQTQIQIVVHEECDRSIRRQVKACVGTSPFNVHPEKLGPK